MNNFIEYISFEVIIHTTEDENKVKKALYFLFNNINVDIKDEIIEGYYGNIMKIIKCKILKKKNCYDFLYFLKKNLILEEKKKLISKIRSRIDPNLNLYIRVNKQKSFMREIELSEEDYEDSIIIKIKLRTYPKSYLKACEIMEEFFEQF